MLVLNCWSYAVSELGVRNEFQKINNVRNSTVHEAKS